MKRLGMLISILTILLTSCASKYEQSLKTIDKRETQGYKEDAIVQDEEPSI